MYDFSYCSTLRMHFPSHYCQDNFKFIYVIVLIRTVPFLQGKIFIQAKEEVIDKGEVIDKKEVIRRITIVFLKLIFKDLLLFFILIFFMSMGVSPVLCLCTIGMPLACGGQMMTSDRSFGTGGISWL